MTIEEMKARKRELGLTKYAKAGVREYWMVDPNWKQILVYHFENNHFSVYNFTDKVPLGISQGKCEVDFSIIKSLLL